MRASAEFKETGQLAYEAFSNTKGGYDKGRWLPPWDQLPGEDQQAWRDAAHEVMQKGWADAWRVHGRHKWK